MSAVKWLLIASLLLMATSNETHAQERAVSTGRWLPREVRFTNLTAAQRAEATAVIDEFERILKQIPEVANPVGYEILPVLVGGARQHGTDHRDLPGSVMEYGLGLMHFRPTRRSPARAPPATW